MSTEHYESSAEKKAYVIGGVETCQALRERLAEIIVDIDSILLEADEFLKEVGDESV